MRPATGPACQPSPSVGSWYGLPGSSALYRLSRLSTERLRPLRPTAPATADVLGCWLCLICLPPVWCLLPEKSAVKCLLAISWRVRWGLRSPNQVLSHLQTRVINEVKLFDFVGIFIAHILAKKKYFPGQVSSGYQNRSRDPSSRVMLLKFEVMRKPEFSSKQLRLS